jgi:catechol 2,3-dioxygenase-like lactoylglutathione lyase family enzyme
MSMFTHIMLGVNDIAEAKKFYDATMSVLGYREGEIDPKGRLFYRDKRGIFGLSIPIDGQPATGGNGSTIGFAVESAEQAEAWHAAGLAHGGTAIEDPPGVREGGGVKMHLAYLRDPAGNKICTLLRM